MKGSGVQTAVLIPTYRGDDGQVRLVVVRRAEGGLHGGQLAFPGGKVEPEDDTLLDTAIRETEEEIGLPAESVEILEELPMFNTLSTGFVIAPFLARIVPPPAWRPDAREIAEVLDVTLGQLTDPAAQGWEMRKFDDWPNPIRIDYTRIGDYELWGATYRILQPLLPRLVAGEWSI